MLKLLVLYASALLTLPLSNDCGFFPSLNGDCVLVACRPGDVLSLVVHTGDGAATRVQIEADIARDGVPTGPASWSPSSDRVALEIGLDEEPGILLIDLKGQPMAVFVDRALVDSNVSGTQPQWDASGKWLIFATSGTGDWENEGVYGYRVSDGALFRLASALPRRLKVAGDFVYLERADHADPSKVHLVALRLQTLLEAGTRMGDSSSKRRLQKH